MNREEEKLAEKSDPDFNDLDHDMDFMKEQFSLAYDANVVYDELIAEADAQHFEHLGLSDPDPDDPLVREWLRDTPELLLELRMKRARRERITLLKNTGLTLASFGVCAMMLTEVISSMLKRSRHHRTPDVQEKALSTPLEQLRMNIRKTMIDAIVQPYFTGTYLLGKLTGVEGARLEWKRENDLYVSIPIKAFHGAFDTQSMNEVIGKITRNPQHAPGEWAKDRSPATVKGMTLSLESGAEPVFFIAFPEDDLWIDPDQPLEHRYGPFVYDPTPRELWKAPVFGGKIRFSMGDAENWSNHGAFVATAENAPMKRLAYQIIGDEKDPHRIAQKILDFVHEYVPYNHQEANFGTEVLRHGQDILMAGKGGDCSTQTIIFASLLEQVGVDYLLAYRLSNPGHITVYVEWKLPCDTDDVIVFNRKRYARAEETCRGFEIGRSRIPHDKECDYQLIQKPSSRTIINRSTGKVISVQ